MSHNLCVYLGLLQVLDGNQRITYNGLVQTERYIAQIHKRIRNESIKGQEENTLLLKHQKEKIDNLEETKTKLEKEKEDLEEKLKHSGSCPICWNPYDCDKNGGVSKKTSVSLTQNSHWEDVSRESFKGRILTFFQNIRHMKCGHTVCSQCLEQLKRSSISGLPVKTEIKCPTCTESCQVSQIRSIKF